HDEQLEEADVMEILRSGSDVDEQVPEPEPEQINPFAAIMATGGEHEDDPPVPTQPKSTLFDDDDNFLTEALGEIVDDSGKLDVYRDDETDMLAFDTPKDLAERLRDLPQHYLSEQEVTKRIRLTG